jgi:DNA-binding HxlR family transcriptional regulator
MNEENFETFKELLELIPVIIKTSEDCVVRELHKFPHDLNRLNMEREGLRQAISLIQGKWTIDILYLTLVLGESHYSELKKGLPKISSRILNDRLKELEENKILDRIIHNTRPVGVSYKLTEYGRKLILLLVPLFLFWMHRGKI